MKRNQIGEEVRDLGLEGQLAKKDTPTMGGVLILGATLIPTLLFANLTNTYLLIMLVALVWFGLLGGMDDYIKVFKRKKAGLHGYYKLAGQSLLGIFVAVMLFVSPETDLRLNSSGQEETTYSASTEVMPSHLDKELTTTIPFMKNNELNYRSLFPEGKTGAILGWALFAVIIIFVVTALSNGANLTDGLDGLAAGVSVPVVVVLGIFAYLSGNVIYATYLNIVYIPNVGELMIFMGAFVGALVGFLWFNSYPAEIFMGDTGSLTIGGVIGVFAILVRKELMLPLLCGIFLIESLSVILQVSYFKYTKMRYGVGRRIFLMSPLHHHYQKKKVPESRIVSRFWIVSILLAVLTVVTLKIR